MDEILGREREKGILEQIRSSTEPEFLAVYGRRRVGKTFLISQFFKNEELYFELTGTRKGRMHDQLANFADVCTRSLADGLPVAVPKSWREAFSILVTALERRPTRGKTVLFFDELPWLASPNSRFLEALGYFWNSWASRQKDLVLIVCGSAASWMIQKVIDHKGGLHNRVTRRIRLMPFDLKETEYFLRRRGVQLDRRQVLDLYMAMGGIPQYLRQVQPGRSAAQNIDEICFAADGFLSDEFDRLYASLFDDHEVYVRVIEALARRRAGLPRTALLEAAGLPSGGTSTLILTALEESGFIAKHVPFGKKVNDGLYRLADEYSLFYLSWIKNARRSRGHSPKEGYWLQRCALPAWRAWAGYSFERVCWRHAHKIKDALSIGGIRTEESPWSCAPDGEGGAGCQIDLLIDRSDGCITLCEMKCTQAPFEIRKPYAAELRRKVETFKVRTRTRKTVFTVMVTTNGTHKNAYYHELISGEVTLDALFL